MTFCLPRRLAGVTTVALIGLLGACETATTQSTSPNLKEIAPTTVNEATGSGLFYPAPISFDEPEIRFGLISGVGLTERQFFADQINLAATSPQRTLPIVAQSVGDGRKTLVLLVLGTEGPTTGYMSRALLARLTSVTRFAPAIAEMGLSSEFDIYNMAAVLGFERIVVTDGRTFAHEAKLKAG